MQQDEISPSNGVLETLTPNVPEDRAREEEISTISSNLLMNFRRGLPQSPHDGIKSNDDNISQDNFLKTGDNNLMDCLNLAGHVTNFVDNEASLDFLSNSQVHYNHVHIGGGGGGITDTLQQQILTYNNLSQLMREFEGEHTGIKGATDIENLILSKKKKSGQNKDCRSTNGK